MPQESNEYVNGSIGDFLKPSEPGVNLTRITDLSKAGIAMLANAYFQHGGSWADWRATIENVCTTTENLTGVFEKARAGDPEAIAQLAVSLDVPGEVIAQAFGDGGGGEQAGLAGTLTVAQMLTAFGVMTGPNAKDLAQEASTD